MLNHKISGNRKYARDMKANPDLRVIRDLIDLPVTGSSENTATNNEHEREEYPYYWPNYDNLLTIRSCEREVIEALQGVVKGSVPTWLQGTLLRNGPGSHKVGPHEFKHWFDGSAFLHRFAISDGKVTYQNRFIKTEVYKKNHAAGRIVIDDFATERMPDPCQSIYHRISSVFKRPKTSDNSVISIYPIGDEFYTFTEFPYIHRIDPKTLDTLGRVDISDHVNIVNHTSHPHVTKDGTVYNMGLGVTPKGFNYNVVRFVPIMKRPEEHGSKGGKQRSMFDRAKIVASIPSRRAFHPSYFHTFGLTYNYYIIIEQPVSMKMSKLASALIHGAPITSTLKWFEKENSYIKLISRRTGKVERTFVAEGFFFFHIINQFETHDGNFIVIDVCCYKNFKPLDALYLEALRNMHKDPDYPNLFRGKPLRFVLPMEKPARNISVHENLIPDDFHRKLSERILQEEGYEENTRETAFEKKAAAYRLSSGDIFVTPELLCDLGCEVPRFNYDNYLSRQYRYFYALSSDADLDNPSTLIKVDTIKKSKKTWCESNAHPSEPVFVPHPNAEDEDDGVIVSSVIYGKGEENNVSLLVLDAASFTEIARVDFKTPSPVPRCVHGWFDFKLT